MKEQTYKQEIELDVFNLMDAALKLADILDQPINEHGSIKVNYRFASEVIKRAQQSARIAGNELSRIASGDADLSEIYPQQKGGAA